MANQSRPGDPDVSPSAPQSGSDVDPIGFGSDDIHVLRQHFLLCQELLSMTERENQALHASQPYQPEEFNESRKSLLPRLNQSYKSLKEVRGSWQRLSSAQRQRFPEVTLLL